VSSFNHFEDLILTNIILFSLAVSISFVNIGAQNWLIFGTIGNVIIIVQKFSYAFLPFLIFSGAGCAF
jgi:hypothetical protein